MPCRKYHRVTKLSAKTDPPKSDSSADSYDVLAAAESPFARRTDILPPAPKPHSPRVGPSAPVQLRLAATQVADLAATGCTDEEIATLVGCHADTLTRRFSAALKAGRAGFRGSLRRRQYAIAMQDKQLMASANMLVWLGKQYLGQSDQQQVTTTAQHTVVHAVMQMDADDLRAAVRKMRSRGCDSAQTSPSRAALPEAVERSQSGQDPDKS